MADCYNLGIYDCSAAVGIASEPKTQPPASFALRPAYPNPFNAGTVLSFELPVVSPAQFEVFDVNGQSVGVLYLGAMQPGIHRIPFDGSGLPSGVYLARLIAGDFQQTQKLILLKGYSRIVRLLADWYCSNNP